MKNFRESDNTIVYPVTGFFLWTVVVAAVVENTCSSERLHQIGKEEATYALIVSGPTRIR